MKRASLFVFGFLSLFSLSGCDNILKSDDETEKSIGWFLHPMPEDVTKLESHINEYGLDINQTRENGTTAPSTKLAPGQIRSKILLSLWPSEGDETKALNILLAKGLKLSLADYEACANEFNFMNSLAMKNNNEEERKSLEYIVGRGKLFCEYLKSHSN